MIAALIDHLWQSTVVVAVAGLLAFWLRGNQASVRHVVWFAASLKFLVPFSLLVAIGGLFEWSPAVTTSPRLLPAIVDTVQTIATPFAQVEFVAAPGIDTPARAATPWPLILMSMWAAGLLAVLVARVRSWLTVRAAVHVSTPVTLAGLGSRVRVRATPGLLEPGVVGIWSPVLLIPAGLETTLTADQLRAVIAHEMCHVDRRDNLTSAIHMVVEAVFWFHPLVWWVGARLIDERERACDEHVIAIGAAPEAYAEGILTVCRRYVESPVACVSGVTGADLRARVTAILDRRLGLRLTAGRRVILGSLVVVALGSPLLAGALTIPASLLQATLSSPKFDVVSVKPCSPDTPGAQRARTGESGTARVPITSPGRLHLQCYTLSSLIGEAYIFFANGRAHETWVARSVVVEGGPDWMKSERYAIEATGDPAAPPAVMRGPMLQAILEDRFKLKIRRETRERPTYDLVIAASGAKVSPYTGTDCIVRDHSLWPPPTPPAGQRLCGPQSRLEGDLLVRTGVFTLDHLANFLPFDRPIVNRTGITAPVSVRLAYPRGDSSLGEPPPRSVVAALRDQLGLDLRPSKGLREFLVIDHAERPTPDAAPIQIPGTR